MSSQYRTQSIVLGLSGFLLLFIVWYIAFIAKVYSPLLVPSPIEVIEKSISLLGSKTFLLHASATFGRILTAFIIAAVVGIVLGLFVGYYRIIDRMTLPLIDFMRSIPGIVLFPLFILFFGVGNTSRLLVAIFVAMPIILVNTKYGVINSGKMRKNMSKLYRLDKCTLFCKVIIPEASPYIFTGLRIGISLSIILVIVTEMMLGTTYGVGQLLIHAQYHFETPKIYAIIVLLGFIGYMLNFCFNIVERNIFHWR